MSNSLFPPTINKEALSLNERIGRARQMYSHFKRTGLGQAIAFGEELNSIKEQCAVEHKEFGSALEKIGISERPAQRWMKFANNKRLLESHTRLEVGSVTFEEAEEIIRSAESPTTSVDKKYCSRDCRVGNGPAKCKACAKLNGPPSQAVPKVERPPSAKPRAMKVDGVWKSQRPPRKPITLEDVFELGTKCLKSFRIIKSQSKKIRGVERDGIYRNGTKTRSEQMAESLLQVANALLASAFPTACVACKGAVNTNEDSEPCPGCNGKGWLTHAEALNGLDLSNGK